MAGYCDNFSMIDGDSSNFSMIDGGDEFKAFPGLKGDDGTTFYPHVSAEGVLSWTNDGGKPNPDPVNIKGADGKSAYEAAVEAGFTGTESEFNEYLSGIGDLTALVDRKAGALIDTATGAIASFTPDATIPDLLGVTVAVEPVQDLHGQASPWPAGGGSNLIDDTATADFSVELPAGTYYAKRFRIGSESTQINSRLSVNINGTDTPIRAGTYDDGGLVATGDLGWGSNPEQTIVTTKAYTFTLFLNVINGYRGKANLIMQTGSMPTTYSPYSNLCPISGWSAIGIDAAGVNLLSNAVNSATTSGVTFAVNADRSVSVSTDGTATGRANLFYQGELHLPQGSYYLAIGKAFAFGQCYFELAIYKAATGTTQYVNTNGVAGKAFSLENGDYIRQMYFSVFAGKEVNDTIYPQIETGSTASSYHPFAGNTYTIQLGQTVYGCQLTIDEDGSVTALVDRALTTPTVERINTYGNADYANLAKPVGSKNYGDYLVHGAKSNMYQIAQSPTGGWNSTSGIGKMFTGATISAFWIGFPHGTTLAEMQTALSGLQILYELATPIEIQLDPVTISTISGQTNNVWADAGDVDVTYAADIKAYIDRLNQPTEDDMIANTLIDSGKYFTINNKLYLSTASIAVGAQIIPGHNCTETSLVEALNALNA